MKKLNIFNSILILLMINTGIFAQTLIGPVSPCVDCEQFTVRTEPFNGTWYNPEQSGTGFSIDVQNGKLFGVYYGYDEQGKAIWLTFVGDLVPSDEPNVMWTVDADLLQFENGNAFNQNYSAPNTTEYQEQIHLKFTQKNHAIFSVNNSEEQNIVPIIFGMPASVDFPEQTSYQFPELTGLWTMVYYFNVEDTPEQFTTTSVVYSISSKKSRDVDGDGIEDIYYTIIQYYGDQVINGDIVCKVAENNGQIQGPECTYIDRFLITATQKIPRYRIPIGGLGAFRFFGEADDGSTVEAIKINSKDYINNPVR